MRISIRFFSLLAMLLLGTGVFAFGFDGRFLEQTDVEFNRISVEGNVELIIVPALRSGVAYQESSFGTAKVFSEGMNLVIKSTGRERAKMVVFVKDIYRVIASGNAVVKTEGKLQLKYLQLMLKDRAYARIHSVTEGLYTVLEDRANLRISGTTVDHTVIMDGNQKLEKEQFAALHTNVETLGGAEVRSGK